MKSMFTLQGKIVNVFKTTKGINKDTGEEFGGLDKVQIMGNIPLANGENRMDMVSLTIQDASEYESLMGASVSVPVGFFPNKGTITYFIPKGAQAVAE